MFRNMIRELGYFLVPLLFVLCPLVSGPIVSVAKDTADEFQARAMANGEYMLLQPPSSSSAPNLGSNAANPAAPLGNAGGASMADFGMLMNLIQTTIDPDAWEAGDATMQPYPGGIFLDTDGVVHRCKVNPDLSALQLGKDRGDRSSDMGPNKAANSAWLKSTTRRVVSTKRLLRAVKDYSTRGVAWDRELSVLAGLHRIDFVVLARSNQDLLLIGPAGGEVSLQNGTWVHSATKTSPILLQDVLTLIGAFANQNSPTVMCSLDPTTAGVARVHALLSKPDAASRLVRNPAKGAEELARTMGNHQVTIAGLDPSSPTALALLEADLHMKRLGLGLESAGAQLTSYPAWSQKLDLQPSGQLLRWWFMPDYPEIQCNAEKTVFAIPSRRIRLDSERQMMDAAGNRNPAGVADEAADKFAEQFTANFSSLQTEFPLYGRLSHIFDIAVACKLATEHSDWQASPTISSTVGGITPKEVAPSTATGTWKKGTQSHKWIVVSGGVELDLKRLDLKQRLIAESGYLSSNPIGNSQPEHDAVTYWWWDETTISDK